MVTGDLDRPGVYHFRWSDTRHPTLGFAWLSGDPHPPTITQLQAEAEDFLADIEP